MQKILEKFDYESLLIKEYKNWYLILRKEQTTLGSLVLIEKSFKTKYSDISSQSFLEFGEVVKEIERTLSALFIYDKINYLMLMMVDDEVHYHIVPRYSHDKIFDDIIFKDNDWKGPPNFNEFNKIDNETRKNLIKLIKNSLE